jgi:hypothetical protein
MHRMFPKRGDVIVMVSWSDLFNCFGFVSDVVVEDEKQRKIPFFGFGKRSVIGHRVLQNATSL